MSTRCGDATVEVPLWKSYCIMRVYKGFGIESDSRCAFKFRINIMLDL